MSAHNYIDEIKVLNKKNVHIKDKKRVNEILNSIIEGGSKKLQIVFDFDRTITKQHDNGKAHLSSFGKTSLAFFNLKLMELISGMFRHCKSVPPQFLEAEEFLRNKYFPLEVSPAISREEKIKYMEEWWMLSEEAFK